MRAPARHLLAIAAVAFAIGAGPLAIDAHLDSSALHGDAWDKSPAAAEPPTSGPTWDVIVVDRTDRSPVAGAIVWVRSHGRRLRTWTGTTDDQGRYTIVAPDGATQSFDVTVAHPGHVPNGLLAAVGAPDDSTVELERAEPIGGVVRDERGRPIAGARVFATAYPAAMAWPEITADPNGGLVMAITDEQGRWRSDALPVGSRRETRVRVIVSHPDHVAEEFGTIAGAVQSFAGVQILRTGRSLSGTVLSPFGRPIRGAAILIATPPWDDRIIRLTTDREGRFRTGRFLDPRWPKVVLSAQAPGLAWDFRDVDLSPDEALQVIRLTRRRPVEGRVVDHRGRPLAGAVVSANRRYFKGLVDWEARTDPDGRFIWHDAPTAGVLLIDVTRPGSLRLNRSLVRPGDDEVTITLQPE